MFKLFSKPEVEESFSMKMSEPTYRQVTEWTPGAGGGERVDVTLPFRSDGDVVRMVRDELTERAAKLLKGQLDASKEGQRVAGLESRLAKLQADNDAISAEIADHEKTMNKLLDGDEGKLKEAMDKAAGLKTKRQGVKELVEKVEQSLSAAHKDLDLLREKIHAKTKAGLRESFKAKDAELRAAIEKANDGLIEQWVANRAFLEILEDGFARLWPAAAQPVAAERFLGEVYA
jgi:hypothetical protein